MIPLTLAEIADVVGGEVVDAEHGATVTGPPFLDSRTPEPGGLSARELLDSVRRICLELPVVGVDVVEVSPPYDHADITAALANRVVLEALSAIARKRQDERDGTTWDPSRPLLDRP